MRMFREVTLVNWVQLIGSPDKPRPFMYGSRGPAALSNSPRFPISLHFTPLRSLSRNARDTQSRVLGRFQPDVFLCLLNSCRTGPGTVGLNLSLIFLLVPGGAE